MTPTFVMNNFLVNFRLQKIHGEMKPKDAFHMISQKGLSFNYVDYVHVKFC